MGQGLRRLPAGRLVRGGLLVVALASCTTAVVSKRHDIGEALARLDVSAVLLSAVLVLAATVLMMLSWRALLGDLGSPLPLRAASRVFFLAQLGKYLPGSVWSIVAQVDLARDHHVPRRRSTAAAVLMLAVSVGVGLVVAGATLPFSTPDAVRRWGWAFTVVPVLVVLLHPRFLNPLLGWAFRVGRREPLEQPVTLGGIGRCAAWAAVAWLAFGLHAVVLVRDLGGTGRASVVGAIGAFALAWTVGFLFVVAPAGAGVREAVLVLALAPALHAADALLVALVSRLLLTAADLLLAGAAVVAERRRQRRQAVGRRPPLGADDFDAVPRGAPRAQD